MLLQALLRGRITYISQSNGRGSPFPYATATAVSYSVPTIQKMTQTYRQNLKIFVIFSKSFLPGVSQLTNPVEAGLYVA